jgi:hypothetical protein
MGKQDGKCPRRHFSPAHIAFCLLSCLLLAWPASVASAADYVIHISVDGLRPDILQTVINSNEAPNFKRFQNEGAWTHNARNDNTYTITLPNHTTMLTGRPVSQPSGMPAQTQHGYTDNGTPPASRTLHNFTSPAWYKASTFDVVHDAGLSTALYASKDKFKIFDQSYNAANGAPNATYGSDKIDRFFGPEQTSLMQSTMLTELATNHPKYTFLHYADTDDAGHASGWESMQYTNAIKTIDGYLGQLFNLITTDATFAGKTAIVLSADHGGTGTGHGTITEPKNFTIEFYAWGAGVAHGDLYAFNADTRTNPGRSQVTYTAAGQPIRNGDGGNLALDLLGLGPIPGSLINFAQNLRVALPGDFNLDNIVDATDYVTYRNGLGTKYTEANYNVWRANYGHSVGSGAAMESVPEPGEIMLAGCLLSALAMTRRQRITLNQTHRPAEFRCRSSS